ncbi:MAG: sulfite exporter TauE/SafE family protein [Planctomycetota bacterium]
MILFITGIIIGAVGTLAGIGGGIFIVPILFSVYHFSPQLAIGTSLFVVVFNAFSGTIAYARYKRIYWRLGAIIIISGIPGMLIGAYVSTFFTGLAFRIVFACVLVLAAIHLLLKRNKSLEDIKTCTPIGFSRAMMIMIVSIGFITGFIASLLGIGGGIIHVPVLIHLLKIPVHIATATSHFILFSTVLLSVIPHTVWGHIDYTRGLLMGGGALIGAQIGAYISFRVRSRVILIILACVLLAAALKMLFSAVAVP